VVEQDGALIFIGHNVPQPHLHEQGFQSEWILRLDGGAMPIFYCVFRKTQETSRSLSSSIDLGKITLLR
jgi:hypothetical protein